jgi:hypothetical protein
MTEIGVLPGRAARSRTVLDVLTIDQHLDGPDVAPEVATPSRSPTADPGAAAAPSSCGSRGPRSRTTHTRSTAPDRSGGSKGSSVLAPSSMSQPQLDGQSREEIHQVRSRCYPHQCFARPVFAWGQQGRRLHSTSTPRHCVTPWASSQSRRSKVHGAPPAESPQNDGASADADEIADLPIRHSACRPQADDRASLELIPVCRGLWGTVHLAGTRDST